MARYTPEFLASIRRRYEGTVEPMPAIAADYGIGLRTLHRMVEREGWTKRGERPPRELPDAVRLLDEAQALAASPLPERGRSNREAVRVGVNKRDGEGDPSPSLSGEGEDKTSPIERLARLVEKEIAAEEIVRAQLGSLPRTSAEAERTARTLATLTQTLHALQRLRSGEPQAADGEDDTPHDIDEFRRDLARRIDAFVASRTKPRHADGDAGPGIVDEAE